MHRLLRLTEAAAGQAKELKTLENQLKKEEHNLAKLNGEVETSATSPACRWLQCAANGKLTRFDVAS